MASVVGGDEVCTTASATSMPKRIHSARRTGGRACRRHGYPTIPDRHGIDACQSNLAE
jgi:hypothetical protein